MKQIVWRLPVGRVVRQWSIKEGSEYEAVAFVLIIMRPFQPLCARYKQVPPFPQKQTAQPPQFRRLVIADMETHVPVRGAIVTTKSGYRDTTNYRGICFIPTKFDTLSVSRSGYLTESLLTGEVKDSTFLLPNMHRLPEVTVWGEAKALST